MSVDPPDAGPPRHLYVHVPFCGRRCSYCDFAIAVRRRVPVGEYAEAVDRELTRRFPSSRPWSLDTLYLGGGTPSKLGGDGVARVIETVSGHARLDAGAEVTIEANPEDVNPESVSLWRRAGVNRVSLGVQSFDERVLRWMHRGHDGRDAERAIAMLRGGGIANVSLDLIFSLPESVGRDWARDLDRALALEPSHLSLYGLTVESGTPLGRWAARGEVVEAPEECYEADFLLADQAAAAAGLEHYEVSNFGRPGSYSRHNRSYWSGAPYAGIGPGAHEFDGSVRRWNVGGYAAWVRALQLGDDPMQGRETLDAANREAEAVYLGLRTSDGLLLRPGEDARAASWRSAGWATLEGGRLRLTPLGWLRLDSIAASLTVWRSR